MALEYEFIPEKPISTNSDTSGDKTVFIFDTEDKEFDVATIKFKLVNSNVPITVLYSHLATITLYLNDSCYYHVYYPLVFKTDTPFSFIESKKFKGVIKIEITRNTTDFKLYMDMKITIAENAMNEFKKNEIDSEKHFKQYKLPLYPFNHKSILNLPISEKQRKITIIKSDDYVNISTFTNSNPIPNFNKEGDSYEIPTSTNYLIVADTYSYNPGMKQKFIYFNVEC